MENASVLRRSLFGVPADGAAIGPELIESDADELMFDLEDSVAPGNKRQARSTLIETVDKHEWNKTTVSCRINGTATRWWYEDIINLVEDVGVDIDTIVIPKVRSASEVETVSTLLQSVEMNVGIDPGSIGLSVQIETAEGMSTATEIVRASDRLDAVIFGPADYTASVGAIKGESTYPGHYWHYPLSRIAHVAAAEDLLAISGPYGDATDHEGFFQACNHERALGYDGKVVINPAQVATANEVFSPGVAEAKRARRIVETYEKADPTDVASIDGNVIDRQMYLMAKRIYTKATTAGIL